jgi:hypothetical protein
MQQAEVVRVRCHTNCKRATVELATEMRTRARNRTTEDDENYLPKLRSLPPGFQVLIRVPWHVSTLDDISPETKTLGQEGARDLCQPSNELRLFGNNTVFKFLEFGPIIST